MRIAHVVNPFRGREGSEHSWVQPITFETMRRARAQAETAGIEVELHAVAFPDELDCIPRDFIAAPALERSMLDLGDFGVDQRLPLLRDILERLYDASRAEVLVYTNVDIALMPGFYRFVAETFRAGTDAFIINRRTIPGHYRRIDQLEQMMAEVGLAHPGYDCFVFPRTDFARYDLGDVCLGQTGVGRALLLNMLGYAKHFYLFRDLHLTFYIGDDCRWEVPDHPYRLHNFNENLRVMRQLAAAGRLPRHPLVQRAVRQMRQRFAESGEDLDLSVAETRPIAANDAPDAGAGLAALFVCQSGRLEIMSLLLVHSLRRFMPGLELVACLPTPAADWGEIDDSVREALKGLGVRLHEIENPFGTSYPIGNKLPCLGVPTEATRRVFLDTDMLCTAPFADELSFGEYFAAKPADLATFRDQGAWRRIYKSAGLVPSPKRVRATVSGDDMPLYFNSGVVVCDGGSALADAWIQHATRIADMPDVPMRDPHLDQIALPVAVEALELDTRLLDDDLNFPAHLRPMTDSARLVHYHWPHIIDREPHLRALVREAAEAIPVLGERMRADPEWAPLLASTGIPPMPGPPRQVPPARNLIISGIPRSGTSYLCAALHSYSDCVVVNEPSEVFTILGRQVRPWDIANLYQDLRRRIRTGAPIANKLDGNRLIEDTSKNDTREEYRPEVTREDFLLGTKNTLLYLSRLDAIKQVMPGAQIVLCVRNPVDTIASWITSFPHLRDAALPEDPLVGVGSPVLDPAQHGSLHAVASFESPAWRRAALWTYLAGLVRKHADGALVLDYADLMADPGRHTEHIVRAGLAGPVSQARGLPAVRLGNKRSVLTDEDHAAIDALCRNAAEALGIELPPARRIGPIARLLRRRD